ncbi:hypothetical protein D3C72_2316760 [compost metagenome]
MPSSSPSTIMASALRIEPCARAIETSSPSTISEKYSGAPKLSAARARGGAKKASSSVATVPAKNEPMAAVAKAAPALPFRAI